MSKFVCTLPLFRRLDENVFDVFDAAISVFDVAIYEYLFDEFKKVSTYTHKQAHTPRR